MIIRGPGFLKDYLGKDATAKFKYFGHSQRAMEMVNEMAIGVLKTTTSSVQ